MNNKFYRFRSLLFALLAGFAFVSCSDDDEDEVTPNADNKVVYNGTTYPLMAGLVEDYGSGPNHYNYDFYVTDGTVTVANDDISLTNAKILVYAELYSSGTAEFKTGTFTYQDMSSDDDEPTVGKNVFEYASVVTDSNNDKKIDQLDVELEATGGTIKVSGGSNRNYTIEYDLVFADGRTLKGSFAGTFTYRQGE